MQLLAKGVADLYLTDRPEYSPYLKLIERFQPFDLDTTEVPINAPDGMDKPLAEFICNIPTDICDLVIDSHVVLFWSDRDVTKQLPQDIVHAVIEYIELNVGGQMVSRWYGDLLSVWEEITDDPVSKSVNDYMTGKSLDYTGEIISNLKRSGEFLFRLPLFGNGIFNAFPLCSLNKHTVKLIFRTNEVAGTTGKFTGSVRIRGGYLSGKHREYFTKIPQTYIYPKVQYERLYFEKNNISLQDPVFALVLLVRSGSNTELRLIECVTSFKVYLNDIEFVDSRKVVAEYESATFCRYPARFHFFARKISAECIPNGAVNFSRFRSQKCIVETDGTEGSRALKKLYALSHGVAIFKGGLLGLPF